MADTISVTCTEKKGNGSGDVYEPGSVYVRTITFATLASATGYGDTDIINLSSYIPANTQIIAASAKSSVTQGSATFAINLGGGTAFAAAVAVTATTTFQPLAITVANANTGATDQALQVVIGAATCAAATVTLSLVCAALGTTEGLTTYTI
jgi:hypothetical protein